jgi:quercetin dioxygenase-like cupin family protein
MNGATTVVRQQGEGERLWFAGGGVFTMKASAEDTAEGFVLFEDSMVQGKMTPLHQHPNEDEALYVLEGELRVHIDDEEHALGQGGFFLAPRGVPHAFMVTSENARVLCLQTPGTGEGFYRDASEPATSEDDASRPPDFARLRAAAESSPSIEILGPPPFAAAAVQA